MPILTLCKTIEMRVCYMFHMIDRVLVAGWRALPRGSFCLQESILTFCKTKEVNRVTPHLSNKKHTSEWGFPGAVLRLPRGCPGRMAWIHFYGFQACGAVARPGGFASVVLV